MAGRGPTGGVLGATPVPVFFFPKKSAVTGKVSGKVLGSEIGSFSFSNDISETFSLLSFLSLGTFLSFLSSLFKIKPNLGAIWTQLGAS